MTDPPTGSKIQADIVTVSESSSDPDTLPELPVNTRVVSGPGEYEVADVLIAGVATVTEPDIGARSTGYVFRFEDLAICHLGGARTKLTAQQIEEIGNVDLLLVPVGGNGSLGPAEAAEVVHQLEPRVVIPMGYQLGSDGNDGAPIDHFVKELGKKEFTREPKLTVSKNSLPPDTRVVVLESKRG